MTAALEIRALSCGHGEALFDGLDLVLAPGGAVAFVGPNGAGKTTLLLTIAGLLPALSGSVLLRGEDLGSLGTNRRARLLALLSQEDLGEESLSVEELVQLGRTPYLGMWGRLGPEDAEAVERALEACQLTHLRGRRLDRISGGERQRARIAMAVAQRPAVLLLDEPANHLDLRRRHELFELVSRLRTERQLAVIMVLHDLVEAYREADDVLTIAGGQILRVAGDDPERVQKLAAAFEVPPERISL